MKKVSRERVGKELVSMLVGSAAHPERALRLIHELRLCAPIFLPPAGQQIYNCDGTGADGQAVASDSVWDLGYAYAARMYKLVLAQKSSAGVASADDASKATEAEQNALKLRILAAFLLPFADQYVMEKKRQVLLPTFVIRESLKVRCLMCESDTMVVYISCVLFTVANTLSGVYELLTL